MIRALLVILLAGCGHKAAPPVATTGSDSCEQGRCLPELQKRIFEHKTESRACFDTAKQKDPKLAGFVVINYTIDGDGHVEKAEPSDKDDQIPDVALAGCLAGVIQGITFDKSAKGTTTRGYHRFELGDSAK